MLTGVNHIVSLNKRYRLPELQKYTCNNITEKRHTSTHLKTMNNDQQIHVAKTTTDEASQQNLPKK